MSVECQVNVKSQSELDIGGRETCSPFPPLDLTLLAFGHGLRTVAWTGFHP